MAPTLSLPFNYISRGSLGRLTADEQYARRAVIAVAAAVSELAYSDDPVAQFTHANVTLSSLRKPDSELITHVCPLLRSDNFPHDLLLVWSKPLETLFIGIRGSSRKEDWYTNLNIFDRVDTAYTGLPFHAGFIKLADKMPSDLIAYLVTRKKLGATVLCGHSLGGALASILALPFLNASHKPQNAWKDMGERAQEDTYLSVVTFGAPPSFRLSGSHSSVIAESYKDNCINIIHPKDPVPFLYSQTKKKLQSIVGFFAQTVLPPPEVRFLVNLFIPNLRDDCHFGVVIFKKNNADYDEDDDLQGLEDGFVRTSDSLSISERVGYHSMKLYMNTFYNYFTSKPGSLPYEADSGLEARKLSVALVPTLPRVNLSLSTTSVQGTLHVNSQVPDLLFSKALTALESRDGSQSAAIVTRSTAVARISGGFDMHTELKFSVPIETSGTPGTPPGSFDASARWQKTLAGMRNSLQVRDIFGYSHPIDIAQIEVPSLHQLERPDAASTIKRAAVLAIIRQYAESDSDESTVLAPRVLAMCLCIDEAAQIARSSPASTNSFPNAAEDSVLEYVNESWRMDLEAIGDEVPVQATDAQQDMLLSNTCQAYFAAMRSQEATREDHLRSLNLYLSLAKSKSFSIVSLLYTSPELLFEERSEPTQDGPQSFGFAGWSAFFVALWPGYIIVTFIRAFFNRGTTSTNRSLPQTYLAIAQFFSDAVGLPSISSTSAFEIDLYQRCKAGTSLESLVALFSASAVLTSWNLRPTPLCKTWLKVVVKMGELRTHIGRARMIGAIGPMRLGKSTLLTNLYNLPDDAFNAGAGDDSRTLNIKTYILDTNTVSSSDSGFHLFDLPGLDESDPAVRRIAALASEQLHIRLFVLDYKEARTDPTKELLRAIGRAVAAHRTQPFLVLLNRVDQVLDKKTIGKLGDFKQDILDRKAAVVSTLVEGAGGRRTISTIAATPIAIHGRTDAGSNPVVHHVSNVPFEDVVKVTCFDLETGEQRRAVLESFIKEGLIWTVDDIKHHWLTNHTVESQVVLFQGKGGRSSTGSA